MLDLIKSLIGGKDLDVAEKKSDTGTDKVEVIVGDEILIREIVRNEDKSQKSTRGSMLCSVTRVSRNSFHAVVIKTSGRISIQKEGKVEIDIYKGEHSAKSVVKVINSWVFMKKHMIEIEIPVRIKWEISQRRKHDRVKVRLNSKAEFNKQGFYVELVDIGPGGIGILSPKQAKKDDVIRVDTLYPYLPERLKARVAWIDRNSAGKKNISEYKMGLEFVEMSDDDLKKLKVFCESRLQ
jgi:c-di-GMP-binding flagellar brake protein YcgR